MTIIILLLSFGSLALWGVLATLRGLGTDGYGRLEVARRNIRPDDLPR
ncbi:MULTISPECIES: hypothetical protein [Cryobacterium]|nr:MULTISPECIES: hypothetical protein [Cryobacterium]